MRFMFFIATIAAALCAVAPRANAEENEATRANTIPATRPAVKRALEALKQRQPRLPLPPPTEEERQAAGDRPLVNNGRMAAIYLPASWRQAKWARDPAMTLDYAFTTECFWIVSRANNCHY